MATKKPNPTPTQAATRAAQKVEPKQTEQLERREPGVRYLDEVEPETLPKLRYVSIYGPDISPVRIGFNPEVGSVERPAWLPGRYGWQLIRPHSSPEMIESFERDGVQNPVFLWARFGELGYPRLLIRWGGSRVTYARDSKIHIPAIVADYDGVYADVPDSEITFEDAMRQIREFRDGVRPNGFIVRNENDIDLEIPIWREQRS